MARRKESLQKAAAGSGVDKILTAWKEQSWKKPEFDFSERSDRVTLKLEVGQARRLLDTIRAISDI